MKKMRLFPVLAIAVAGLASCNNNQYGKYCEQALDVFPTLINFSTGKEVFSKGEEKIKAADYTMYLGLEECYWQNINFKLTWTPAPAEKWAVSSYTNSDGTTRQKFRPLFDAEEFDCSLTVKIESLNAKGKVTGNASKVWNFHTAKHEAPDLTSYTHVTTEQLAKGQISEGTKVYTYGYTTTSHEPSDTHLYTGVYMQDGEYGTLMYAGKLSSIWFAGGFEIGDRVMVGGVVSPYNGLVEIKPDFLEFTKDTDPLAAAVAQPVVREFDAEHPFTEDAGKAYQSALVRIKDLTYKSGKITSVSSTTTLVFNQNGTTVNVSCNYHLGTKMMGDLQALVDTFTADETKVEFYGPASYFNAVQVIPTFGVDSLIVK